MEVNHAEEQKMNHGLAEVGSGLSVSGESWANVKTVAHLEIGRRQAQPLCGWCLNRRSESKNYLRYSCLFLVNYYHQPSLSHPFPASPPLPLLHALTVTYTLLS